jgi:hypothetical protein
MDKMLPLFVYGIAHFFHAMRSFRRGSPASGLPAGPGLKPSAHQLSLPVKPA